MAIETDRPDVTPYTVPKGSLQAENGVAWTGDEAGHTMDLTESLLRIGIATGTELRVGIPDFFYRLQLPTPPSGFNDLLLGVKQRIGTFAGFDFAVVPAITLPTGSGAWSSHGVDPQLEIPWQRDLGKRWSISGTLGIFYLTDNGRRRPLSECQVEFERDVGKAADVFVEYQAFDGVGLANNSIQLGGGYKIKPNHRVDYFAVIGLSRAAPNVIVGVGYSFRLDHLLKK